eukprot:TRINITY_DN13505_c0_g1_i15.p1 TRINITY_DN13505_c0_g1~~TRINITY_DN13505_c0_g1_i15.p1  ORF type:complete len:186 (-),score=17.17 TRINITY_DN13505_c0_g1_i15:30-587(-)
MHFRMDAAMSRRGANWYHRAQIGDRGFEFEPNESVQREAVTCRLGGPRLRIPPHLPQAHCPSADTSMIPHFEVEGVEGGAPRSSPDTSLMASHSLRSRVWSEPHCPNPDVTDARTAVKLEGVEGAALPQPRHVTDAAAAAEVNGLEGAALPQLRHVTDARTAAEVEGVDGAALPTPTRHRCRSSC